jgi:hypothetical protein
MKQSTVGEGRQLNPLRGNSTRFAATQPASRQLNPLRGLRIWDLRRLFHLRWKGLKHIAPLKVK